MNKVIYEEALEDLAILVKQANARKLSHDIVASRWGVEKITKIIEQAQKQEKLLQLYRRLVNQNLQVNLHILEKIKELENERNQNTIRK